MPEEQLPSGVDLARVAFAAARAAAKQRPTGKPKKKPAATRTNRRGSGRDPVSAMDAVRQMLIDRGYEVPAAGGEVLGAWASMASDFAGKSAAEGFDADTGVLSVRPLTAAYATQCRLNERAIVAGINDRMGRPIVTALRILPQGPARTAPEPSAARSPRARPAPPRPAPDGYREAKAVIEVATRATADPLAASVRRASDAQTAALRDHREPREDFTDAVAFQDDLERKARDAEDPRRRARAYTRAEKAGLVPSAPLAASETA